MRVVHKVLALRSMKTIFRRIVTLAGAALLAYLLYRLVKWVLDEITWRRWLRLRAEDAEQERLAWEDYLVVTPEKPMVGEPQKLLVVTKPT
jgi:peptidoglycan/LPS O-acetylase OafA/YrhL